MSVLIGLTGRAQHGKDSFGSALVQRGYTRVAFADKLKSLALTLDPIVNIHGNRLSLLVEKLGWEGAKQEPEVRRFLQVLGTEGVREHIGDDTWVRIAMETVASIDGPVVITDVRFPNEVDAVRASGGYIVRIRRPGFDNGLPVDHPSEAFIDQLAVDAEVLNIGTLSELYGMAQMLAADVEEGFIRGGGDSHDLQFVRD